jgi:O-antigen/teichoic acid export membrane protein
MTFVSLRQLLRPREKDGSTFDHASNRLRGILRGLITAFGNRLIAIAVSLLSVPLTVGYLGAERYGAWIAIGSLLAWLQLADLGIANGLTNAVTSAVGRGREDLARIYISSSLLMLTLIAVVTGIAGMIVAPFIDWDRLFGVTSNLASTELEPALAIAFTIFLLQFPLSVVSKVFLAYQEGHIANYWSAASNVLSLLALVAVTQTEGGLPLLVLAVSGTGLILGIASALWLFSTRRRSVAPNYGSAQLSAMKEMGRTGMLFFLIQILALIVFQGDNLIIAYFLGAEQVTPYAVTYRLFGYASLLPTLAFSYVWVAYTEAFTRGDVQWVRKTFYRTLVLGTGSTAMLAVPLVIVSQPFIRWWAGAEAVPSQDLVYWMAAWSILHAFTGSIASLLASASHLKAQVVYSLVATIMNVALSILLVHRWGSPGVMAATVISYLVAICIPALIDAELLIRRREAAGSLREQSA